VNEWKMEGGVTMSNKENLRFSLEKISPLSAAFDSSYLNNSNGVYSASSSSSSSSTLSGAKIQQQQQQDGEGELGFEELKEQKEARIRVLQNANAKLNELINLNNSLTFLVLFITMHIMF
jgi:hypothetical protein